MMDSGNGSKEMPSGSLCRNGCGFYGSAATEGMCSKCYKDYLRKKQSSPVQAATALATPSHPVTVSTNLSSSEPSPITSDTASTATLLSSTATGATTISNAANERVQPPIQEEGATAKTTEATSTLDDSCPSPATSGDSPDGSEKGKKKKNRCTNCRKKVGLTGFVCRCGGLYCSIHRYSDKHNCTFDYRSHGQEEIRKNNPIVVGEKIKKL